MKPTLVLLAAGMGSRYGGLKQLDGLGPNGETIMDYSIYDAIQAGLERSYLLFVKISKSNSVHKFFQNMKVIFLQKYVFKLWMHYLTVTLYQKVVPSHGVLTMQS